MPPDSPNVVKTFPKFDDVRFDGLLYRDLDHIGNGEDWESAYALIGRYLNGIRGHVCEGPDGPKFDRNGDNATDLSYEECMGDYAPRNFASFDREGNCVDAFNIHACRVVEREGGRPQRSEKRYMDCRAFMVFDHLNDAGYATGHPKFYQWMSTHTFTLAEGPDIEFVQANIAMNLRLIRGDADEEDPDSRVLRRAKGAVAAMARDIGLSSTHDHVSEPYRTEPDWFFLRMSSKSRAADVVPDAARLP